MLFAGRLNSLKISSKTNPSRFIEKIVALLSKVVMAEFHLTDTEFFSILRENAGLFSRTAKAITEKYGIEYSRQAARQRALEQPEVLTDIEDEGLDIAEGGMRDLMISKDEDIKFKSCQFVLKTKGKKRGYVERQEISPVDKDGNDIQPVININVVQPDKTGL